MIIYKQYDQAALDRQYNNRLQVPGHAVYLDRCETMSREAEKNVPAVYDIPYGDLDRERLDIYPALKPGAKTLIFIHGGYWHKLDKSSFRFIAAAYKSYDITTVLITYPLAPVASMEQIVASCRKATEWVYKNISTYNGDPGQVYVAGHSAGGHLAVMLMSADWHHSHKRFAPGMIKGVCALSGLFNLQPIRLSDINQVLKLDEQTALRNSPVELMPVCPCPLLVAVGADESDEFKSQSEELYNCWKDQQVPVQLLQLQGVNHYSIVEAFADNNSILHHEMKKMMGVINPKPGTIY